MSPKLEIKLQTFCIFNSSFCLKEGEEENKILYYHPFSADLDTKIRNIGLVEAIIKFTETFNPNEACSSLHTQKSRQVFVQPERNYWMFMVINVPNVSKVKDGVEYTEYQGEHVQDNVYRAVLNQAYSMFRLLSGTYQSIVDSSGVNSLRHNLEHFYPTYLLTLKLEHSDILDVFRGMQYLPLNNLTFLNILCFVNRLQDEFPTIKHTAFMYNDYLVWSGVEPSSFQPVYQYMVGTLLPAHMETELHGGSIPRHSGFFAPTQPQHYCRFVTGPSSLAEGVLIKKTPMVFLCLANNLERYYLIVYRGFSASVIMFVDATTELTLNYFQRLDAFIEPMLTVLGSEIAEYCSTQNAVNYITPTDGYPRFIYFNKLNLAYKTTAHLNNRQTGNVNITQETLKLIADLSTDKLSESFLGETVVKTMNDYWVVGKFSNKREFYVAIHHKNANLIVINEEVKKLCDAELKGIFFQT